MCAKTTIGVLEPSDRRSSSSHASCSRPRLPRPPAARFATLTSPTKGTPLASKVYHPEPIDPGSLPTTDRPDGLVRIVGALVNAVSSPEIETVTLLNVSPQAIDLAGWALLDKLKNRHALSGSLATGESLRVRVAAPMQLSNQGGLVTLLNSDGLRVDGVAYTRDQARNPGWTIAF